MALVSKHYLIANAILTALKADTDLSSAIPAERWKPQKKAWHRGMKWASGAYVIPIRGSILTHENRNHRINFDTIVCCVWPSDGDLALNMEQELAVQERVDLIFAAKGRTTAPATLLALDALNVGAPDQFAFEGSTVRPGESYMAGAFQDGFDAFASVVTVTVTTPKRNSSSLGA